MAKFTHVGESNLQDDTHVRGDNRDELSNFADRTRAHFNDEKPGIEVDSEHRDRGPHVIVERFPRRDGSSLALKYRAHHVLRGCLAVGTGDRYNFQLATRAHPRHHLASECGERAIPIGHHNL